jgi:hypothetical protein
MLGFVPFTLLSTKSRLLPHAALVVTLLCVGLHTAFYRDKYQVLEKFEVQVPDTQVALLDKLDVEWGRFQVRKVPSLV